MRLATHFGNLRGMERARKYPVKGLFRKGRYFYFRYTAGGRRHCVALGAIPENEAIVKVLELKTIPQLLPAGDYAGEVERYLIWAEARGRLSAAFAVSRRNVLRKFGRDLALKDCVDLRRRDVEVWVRGLIQEGKSPYTLRQYVMAVRAFYKWLIQEGKVLSNPAVGVELPAVPMSQRRNFIRSARVQELIAQAPDDELRFVLYAGFHAGMRKLEIVEARAEWFDLDAGAVTIEETDSFKPKDRDRRTVPMTRDFQAFLAGWKMRRPYVLKPQVRKGRSLYRYDFRRPFACYMERMGEVITAHDMRRSFASNLAQKGVSIYKIAKWLGDEVQVVQDHYAHLLPQDEDIERLV